MPQNPTDTEQHWLPAAAVMLGGSYAVARARGARNSQWCVANQTGGGADPLCHPGPVVNVPSGRLRRHRRDGECHCLTLGISGERKVVIGRPSSQAGNRPTLVSLVTSASLVNLHAYTGDLRPVHASTVFSVGQDPLDGDAAVGDEPLGAGPEGSGGLLLLVCVDLAVGEAGVVVDGGVQVTGSELVGGR